VKAYLESETLTLPYCSSGWWGLHLSSIWGIHPMAEILPLVILAMVPCNGG